MSGERTPDDTRARQWAIERSLGNDPSGRVLGHMQRRPHNEGVPPGMKAHEGGELTHPSEGGMLMDTRSLGDVTRKPDHTASGYEDAHAAIPNPRSTEHIAVRAHKRRAPSRGRR